MYSATIGSRRYAFADLATLLAKATPLRSGDCLAGVAAESGEERVAAQWRSPTCRCGRFSRSRWFPTRPTRSPG